MGSNNSTLKTDVGKTEHTQPVAIHYKESCFSYSDISKVGDVLYDVSRKAHEPFNPDLMAMQFSENKYISDTDYNGVIMKKNKSLRYYLANINTNHFRIDIINIFTFWDRRCPLVHDPHAIQNKCPDGLECKCFLQCKYEYNFSKQSYYHLQDLDHPKEKCKHWMECKAFQRLEMGGNELKDLCHVTLYNHAPRKRLIKLTQNFSPFTFETNEEKQFELTSLNDPTNDEITEHKGDFINVLMAEVKKNGFSEDLYEEEYMLMLIQEKLEHPRHLAMGAPLNYGEMLAMILYTGCDSNYDLCASLRNGNASKWKWFDYCLDIAISKLSQWEIGYYPVYSGINNVMLNKREIKNGFFKSYVSASRNAQIAASFKGESGILIEIESRKLFTCCDVSWISKFPNEEEVLFAFYGTGTKWNAKIINQTKDNQKILISKQPQ